MQTGKHKNSPLHKCQILSELALLLVFHFMGGKKKHSTKSSTRLVPVTGIRYTLSENVSSTDATRAAQGNVLKSILLHPILPV